MGFALAEQASLLGADVTLISGPSSLELNKSIKRINVINAEEMYSACVIEFSKADITIMAAAVADYTPVNVSSSKIKKSAKGEMELKLKPTKDILFELGKKKAKSHVLVGFALETDHEVDHAIKKIHNKNLDFIVLNTLKEKGTCFGTETNKITIIDKSKKIFNFDLKHKQEVASDILNHLKKYL
jgi:phosphopantothenoylcysteine decarboxylase/phosphopantothenate--cysteine ligase